jgi:hypothetical protein
MRPRRPARRRGRVRRGRTPLAGRRGRRGHHALIDHERVAVHRSERGREHGSHEFPHGGA